MTKKTGKPVMEQCGLFDWMRQADQLKQGAINPPLGSLNIQTELIAAIKEDLRHACDDHGAYITVPRVAARMSELTGWEITESKFRNWTAPSHPHRFPAEYLPAFVIATGGQRRAFECLSRHSGLFALPGPEALRAEIQRIDEEIKKKQHEKQKRQMFLKEIENGKG